MDLGVENMKNNFKALLLHLIIVAISVIFVILFVVTGPKFGQYTTHIISKLFISIGFILIYIFSGTLLDINTNKKFDFLVDSFIAIAGIALWCYTISITETSLLEITKGIPEELSEYWILMNIYHTPLFFIKFLFGLPNTPFMSLITNLFPSLLMGLGLKYKRLKSIKNSTV